MAGAAQPVLAEESASQGNNSSQNQVEEVIVTAQKRTERLQDVPISVSAISGDSAQKSRLTRADDLVAKVPNLQVSSTVGEGTPIFSLRGVSMSDFSLNQSPPVAIYYDEVYKGNFSFLGVAMYDLERLEVLRGPQGTLYGKNTTGGAINLISRRPNLDKEEGYANVGYGNYNRYEANGAVNVPLGSTFAARIAFTVARADGWFKNRLAGKPDLSGTREFGVRASLLWEPAPGSSFLLRASTSYQHPWNYGVYTQPGPDGIGAGAYEAFGAGTSYFRNGLGNREGELDYTPRRRARTYAVSLTSNFDVGDGLSVTSVTSWDKGRLFFGEDSDGSPLQTISIFYGDRATQFAEDLRLTSDLDGPFNFILGAYFNREKVYNTTEQRLFTDLDVTGDGMVDSQDCGPAFPLACILVNSFDQLKHSYALYSDVKYDLGSRVTLRGGLRFTHDKGTQSDLSSKALGADGLLAVPLLPPSSQKFNADKVTGKIGVDFKINPDFLLYAKYSRGYRGASFNAQAFFAPDEVTVAKPETVDAFEIGAKTQLANRRVTLNTAAFYYEYHNQQFINVDPNTAIQTLVNVDRSRIYGGEIELTVQATDVIGFHAGLGLLKSRIQEGVLSGVDLKGNKLSNAPSVTFTGSLDITLLDNNSGILSVHPEVSYASSQYFEVLNEPILKQSGYALLGGHIDYENGPFNVSLWAKNLANKYYTTARIDVLSGLGFVYNHVGTPRTYGITVGYRF
jgi:iron complex outermembrane receptor protein